MALEFKSVHHAYAAAPVLNGVDVRAEPGEITCLLGPSGGGKSTLLRLAAGLERVQRGEIVLDGAVLAAPKHHLAPERRPVGLVFQDHALFPHMTARDNVAFGLTGAREDRRQRAEALLAGLDLAGLGDRYPHMLSGGQQQRVALARALAPQPRVILMDEPYASVDAALRRALQAEARQTLKAAGGVAVLVTHHPDEALDMADQIAVMAEGRILQAGDPATVYASPAHPAVAALFGESQIIAGDWDGARLMTAYGSLPLADRQRLALTASAPPGPVTLVVRPRAFTLSTAPPVRDPDAASALIVQDIRFCPAGQLVTLTAPSVHPAPPVLRVRVPAADGLSPGGAATLTPTGEDMFVFAGEADAVIDQVARDFSVPLRQDQSGQPTASAVIAN